MSHIADRLHRAAFLLSKEYEWAVGAIPMGVSEFLTFLEAHGRPPDAPVRWLSPPPRPYSFAADPHCLVWRDQLWVFYEAFLPWQGRGVIAAARFDEQHGFVDHLRAIDVPGVHFAYPSVLIEGDEIACVPDSSNPTGTLVYRGASPLSLRPAGILPGVPPLRDPTLTQQDNGILLVGLDIRTRPHALRSYRADQLGGPWHEAGMPIDASDGTARPAGGFVTLIDGRLVRPAQDSRDHYGGGIAVREVEGESAPSVDSYDERVVAYCAPDPSWDFPLAFHTINGTDHVTFIDGYRYRTSMLAAPRRVSRRLVGVSEK